MAIFLLGVFMIKQLLFLSGLLIAGSFQPGYSEPVNLEQVKNQIRHYHDSGKYNQELSKKAQQAKYYLSKKLRSWKGEPQKLAIVFDIDETVLSNYPVINKLNFGGTYEQIGKAILKADAPPIQPIRSVYNFAKDKHMTIFFVTGRHASKDNRIATEKNLKKYGMGKYQQLYLKPKYYQGKQSAILYKAATRKKITEMGYHIVLSIGDQYSDLKGGYTEKGIKLPNPYYYIP